MKDRRNEAIKIIEEVQHWMDSRELETSEEDAARRYFDLVEKLVKRIDELIDELMEGRNE